MLLGYLKGEIEPPNPKTIEEAEKFEQDGYECLNLAIRSLEAWEKELERRGVRHIPLGVKEQDLKNFSEREKRNTIATVLMMSAMVLRDEFGFGRDRMNKFIDRFNKKTSCLVEGYVYWKDMQQTIAEETGIFIPLPDEFLDMGESE